MVKLHKKIDENILEAIIQTVPNLVVILDNQGRIVKFNSTCEKITGYKEAEVIGKSVFDVFIPPEQKEDVMDVFQSLLKTYPNSYVNYWVTKSGKKRLISWYNNCITDENGEIILVVAAGNDITSILDLQERYRELNKELSLIANILSHDLRNNLVAIQGYTELLEEKQDPSLLKKIKNLTEASLKTIDSTGTNFYEINTSSTKKIDLVKIVSEIVERYKKNTPAKIILNASAKAEIIAGEIVSSVFENLIHNAIKHGQPRNIQINFFNKNNRVIVEIIDDSNISPEKVEFIRKQLQSYEMKKASGLGIVGEIIALYDGNITVERKDNKGLKITITFPAV